MMYGISFVIWWPLGSFISQLPRLLRLLVCASHFMISKSQTSIAFASHNSLMIVSWYRRSQSVLPIFSYNCKNVSPCHQSHDGFAGVSKLFHKEILGRRSHDVSQVSHDKKNPPQRVFKKWRVKSRAAHVLRWCVQIYCVLHGLGCPTSWDT